MRNKLTRAGIVAAVAIGLPLTAATVAQAAGPTGCYTSTGGSNNVGYAYCTGGTGQYRVQIICTDNQTYYGAWTNPGGTDSSRKCPAGTVLKGAVWWSVR